MNSETTDKSEHPVNSISRMLRLDLMALNRQIFVFKLFFNEFQLFE